MNEQEKAIYILGAIFFIQIIWIFVSTIIISPYLPNHCGPCSGICEYHLEENIRDMIILFIPFWIGLVYIGFKLKGDGK